MLAERIFLFKKKKKKVFFQNIFLYYVNKTKHYILVTIDYLKCIVFCFALNTSDFSKKKKGGGEKSYTENIF